MKTFGKMSRSNVILLGLCAVVLLVILALNITDSIISSNYQKAITFLSKTDSNMIYLENSRSEMVLADNDYRIFLYSDDTAAKERFTRHIKNIVHNLYSLKESWYPADFTGDLANKLQISKQIVSLERDAEVLYQQAPVLLDSMQQASIPFLLASQVQVEHSEQRAVDTLVIKAEKKKHGLFGFLSGKKKQQITQSYRKGAVKESNTDTDITFDNGISKNNTVHNSTNYGDVAGKGARIWAQQKRLEEQLAYLNLTLFTQLNDGINTASKNFAALHNMSLQASGNVLAKVFRSKNILLWVSGLVVFVIVVLLIRNILHLNKYELDILSSKETSENLAVLKMRVLSNMSHEIRSPLTAISGFSEELHRSAGNTESKEFIQAIARSADYLLKMVNSILDFSRLEAGKLKMKEEVFPAIQPFSDVHQAFERRAIAKNDKLSLQCSFNTGQKLFADQVRIKQILFNLVDNAVKFTTNGSIIVNADIEKLENGKSNMRIVVKDTGIGIPREMQDAVFEEFSQVKTNSRDLNESVKGAGLGLTITRMLVTLLGGDIHLESSPGTGSTFTVVLPVMIYDATDTEARLTPSLAG